MPYLRLAKGRFGQPFQTWAVCDTIAQWQTPQDKPLARHAPVFRCPVNQVRCQPPVRVVTAGQMGSARAFC